MPFTQDDAARALQNEDVVTNIFEDRELLTGFITSLGALNIQKGEMTSAQAREWADNLDYMDLETFLGALRTLAGEST